MPLGRAAEKALYKYLGHTRRRCYGVDEGRLFLTDDGKPLDVNALWKTLHKRGQRAGVHTHPHKFRHSAAIQYLRGGGRLETLKAMLGHTTLNMTMHYARLAGVDLTTAHETCDPARSLKVRV